MCVVCTICVGLLKKVKFYKKNYKQGCEHCNDIVANSISNIFGVLMHVSVTFFTYSIEMSIDDIFCHIFWQYLIPILLSNLTNVILNFKIFYFQV